MTGLQILSEALGGKVAPSRPGSPLRTKLVSTAKRPDCSQLQIERYIGVLRAPS